MGAKGKLEVAHATEREVATSEEVSDKEKKGTKSEIERTNRDR